MGKEQRVELRVHLRADPKEGEQAVVGGGEVAPEVDQPIASRRDLLLQLLVRQSLEEFFDAVDVELPGAEPSVNQFLFGVHGGSHSKM